MNRCYSNKPMVNKNIYKILLDQSAAVLLLTKIDEGLDVVKASPDRFLANSGATNKCYSKFLIM